MKDYPALRQLLQAYLHQDWPVEYSDPWDGVADFARSEPAHSTRLPAEIDEILDRFRSESDLRQLVIGQCQSGYLPEADGWTYRDWLTEVRSRVGSAKE